MTGEASLGSRFDRADDSPGLLLWQVTNRWQAAQRAVLAPLGLTHVQFVLLAEVVWQGAGGDGVTQRAISEHAATDPMMTSQVLRTLEGKGLIVRAPHPTDARARAVTATAAGKRLARRAIAVVETADAVFFGVLPRSTDLPAILRALRDQNQQRAHPRATGSPGGGQTSG